MATYTVKAPDGKTVTLEGPDGASQEDIIAQAQALYKPRTAAEAKTAAPAPKKRASAPNAYLDKYNSIRGALANKWQDHPDLQQRALAQFDSDPRTQKLRKLAGLASLSTRRGEVQSVAKQAAQKGTGVLQATDDIVRLIANGMTLGGADWLASKLGEQNTKAKTRSAKERAGYASLGAELTGNIAGFGGAGKLVAKAARSGVPAISKVGNVFENLTTLRKGKKLKNIGKIAGAGATAGGIQSGFGGENVLEGAAVGAVGAPLVVGGFKTLEYLTRPVRDILRTSTANNILKRFTTATRDEIETAAAKYRARNPGEDPTVYEVLPLRDQENLRDVISRMPLKPREQLAGFANARMKDIAQGFGRQVEQRTSQRAAANQNALAMRLAQSRGTSAPTPEEIALAERAIVDPTDMKTLVKQEARNIMRPHDNTPVAAHFDDLIPDANPITGDGADNQVAEALRGAAGPIRRREGLQGVTVHDITDMLSNLKDNRNLPEGVRQRAVARLENVLEQTSPEVAQAAARMREQFASGMRIREGAKFGRKTVLREDVADEGANAYQKKVNAFDTSEGDMGRSMGQAYALNRGTKESLASSLRHIDEIAESPATQEAIVRNLPEEAAALINSAKDQREAAKALSHLLDPKRMGAEPHTAGSEGIATMLASLSPHAMNYTRIKGLAALNRLAHGIPEGRAKLIVDMLFSRDPAMMQRAFRAIGNESNGAKFTKYLAGIIGIEAGKTNALDTAAQGVDSMTPSTEDYAPPNGVNLTGTDASTTEEAPIEAPDVGESPYGPALQQIYQNESPELIDLIQRVKKQEHGVDKNGNFLTSKAGAIGPMQVMPDTAPEAAALAGLPWDEKAYRSDPAYNELLGIAYLSEMLRKYDGDVDRALAAYNAGPGAVDEALTKHNASWLENLPAETQDYVARVS